MRACAGSVRFAAMLEPGLVQLEPSPETVTHGHQSNDCRSPGLPRVGRLAYRLEILGSCGVV